MSTFGTLFRVTTYGESHCKGVGCVIDGVPPGMALTESDIQPQLTRRRPGQSKLTTPRDEKDIVRSLASILKSYLHTINSQHINAGYNHVRYRVRIYFRNTDRSSRS